MMSVVWEERWADPPVTPVTVPAGAPAVPPGTQQTWVMNGDLTQFDECTADPSAWPPSLFRVFDLRDPREHILVRDSRTPSWGVTRGDGGTPTVDHDPGFAVHNVIAAAGMRTRAGGVLSGNGLVLPACANRSVLGPFTDSEYHACARLPVPAGEAVPGSLYEAIAWGYLTCGSITGAHFLLAGLGWEVMEFGASSWRLSDYIPQLPTETAGQFIRWRLHGMLNVFDPPGPAALACASTELTLAPDVEVARPAVSLLVGPIPPNMGQRAIVTDADRQFSVAMAMSATTAAGGAVTGGHFVVQGGKAWRAA
jgi:hypothetical protein